MGQVPPGLRDTIAPAKKSGGVETPTCDQRHLRRGAAFRTSYPRRGQTISNRPRRPPHCIPDAANSPPGDIFGRRRSPSPGATAGCDAVVIVPGVGDDVGPFFVPGRPNDRFQCPRKSPRGDPASSRSRRPTGQPPGERGQGIPIALESPPGDIFGRPRSPSPWGSALPPDPDLTLRRPTYLLGVSPIQPARPFRLCPPLLDNTCLSGGFVTHGNRQGRTPAGT
jgi:hypothetical protein